MVIRARRFLPLALAGVLLLVVPVLARAQSSNFRITSTPSAPSPYSSGAAWGAGYSPGSNFYTPASALPYNPWGFYNIWPDPYGGGLTGAANAIAAQGQYEIDFQHARLLNQEVERSKMDTRRKQWEEWLFEREHRPTLEDERERQRTENLRRARNNPPFAEIWSGQALNDLLLAVQQQQAQGVPPSTQPLDDDVLQRINVTSGATPSGIGLLKGGGKLHWPLVLSGGAFAADRKRIDDLLGQSVRLAESGTVDADTLQDLKQAIGRLRGTVKSRLDEITPSEDIQARRYLNDLDNAVRALQDPDVAKYLSGRWAARGRTVGDLVAEMSRQGLKFAPAVAGDEAAYVALHRALANSSAPPDPYHRWDPLTK
jgi:hypothetical protein